MGKIIKKISDWLQSFYVKKVIRVVIVDNHDLKKVKLAFSLGHRVAFWKAKENRMDETEIIVHEATNLFHQYLLSNPSLIKETFNDGRKTNYEITFFINPRIL